LQEQKDRALAPFIGLESMEMAGRGWGEESGGRQSGLLMALNQLKMEKEQRRLGTDL
jgi:hypothetical protein